MAVCGPTSAISGGPSGSTVLEHSNMSALLVELAVAWENWQPLAIIGRETMAEPAGEILTLDEVASYLKAGKRTVYRLAAEGKLPAFKLGGTWRFRRSDLDEWIAANLTKKNSGRGD